jgi:TonB family protein
MLRFMHTCVIVALLAAPLMVRAAGERALYAPTPQYPTGAKAHHVTGSGAFVLHIRADGSVERVETLRSIGYPILDRAAIDAFRQWRFHPQKTNWSVRVPIRYVDGPFRVDSAMSSAPTPGWGMLITVFSGK